MFLRLDANKSIHQLEHLIFKPARRRHLITSIPFKS
jgi:hypothetical protein